MKKGLKVLATTAIATSLFLGGCGNSKESTEKADFQVGMVSDTGGIDDKSFNQATWEGLVKFGADNGLTENNGYQVLMSEKDADYVPNLTKFAENNFDLVLASGYLFADSISQVADIYPETNFAIIDSVVEKGNVTSILFEEEAGSFLAGVASALTTKTGKVGFVGGVESDLINKFEAGFVQGVKYIDPNIEIISVYAGSFTDASIGVTLGASIYGQGADVIYHASGIVGNGVFTEAKNRVRNGEEVWVIGVDRDQHEEGMPENVTLTSMVKRVDKASYDMATKAKEGSFPAGETIVYGLEEDGVGLADGNLTDEVSEKVKEVTQKIIDGEIDVISTKTEMLEMFPEMK